MNDDQATDVAGRRAHVLIVEDNQIVSGALRILFEETGRRVSTAATVAEAVNAACADTPDIMLLDVTLPDGDGLSIIQRIQQAGGSTGIVVAVTGHDDPVVTQRCASLGCREVLLKPVPTRELLHKVELLLDGPR